jgi:hypothetical protein
MASVFIDIPGIGTVEAKNAASEATLQTILQVMQGVQRNTAGGRRGGAGGAAPSAGGAGGGGGGAAQTTSQKAAAFSSKMAAQSSTQFGKASNYARQMVSQAGKGFDKVTGTVGFLGAGAMSATRGISNLAQSGAGLADSLANMNDSLTAAAGSLNAIPIVGGLLAGVFGAIASATESLAASMKGATASGASFGGSLQSLQTSSAQAGMTMENFGKLVSQNGEAMGAFGSTTESGAKNFARLSGQLRAAGGDLYALGFGTAEINQGLANYGKLLRSQGLQGTKSNAELVDGSKKYLKEMDLLAKITGESRADKEKEREALIVDNQLAAALADANEDVAASAHMMIGAMPNKVMKDFAKDMIANGTATTAANRLLMSQYPGLAAQLTQMHQVTQDNTVIQKDAMKGAMATYTQEGKNMSNIKQAVSAASDELGTLTEAFVGSRKVNLAAFDDAQDQQAATAAGTDGTLKNVEAMKSQLAAMSDNIKMQLMASGGLGLMMAIVQKLADFVIGVVIPGIGMLIPILGKIFDGAMMLLKPIIESVTKAFGGMGGTLSAVDNILNWLFDTLNGAVRGGILIFESLLRAFDTLSGPFSRLSAAIFGTEESTNSFSNTLILIGDAVGTAFEILAKVIGFVIDFAILPLIGMFQNYFMPTIKSVGSMIMDYLVPILVAAGVAFIAFNAITIAATIAKFALTAAMVIVTGGFALLSAGVAIVAGAFALLTSPIGLTIAAIAALIIIFKKAGGDFQVVTDGLKYLWSGLQTFFSALKLGFFKVLDALPGIDFSKEIEEEEKKIVEQKAEREELVTKMATRMEENKAKAAADAAKGDSKEEGGLLNSLKGMFNIDQKNRAGAHIEQKNAQVSAFKGIPGAVSGGMKSGMPALKEGVKEGVKEGAAKPVDFNAGPEVLLKQFAQREGSPLAGANAQKQAIVAEAEKKKDEAQKQAEAAEEARAAAAKSDPRRLDQGTTPKPQESAETLLAELNTKMATLLKYTFTVAHNTNETVSATRSLNGNLYKA